jgi:hypothetical protein
MNRFFFSNYQRLGSPQQSSAVLNSHLINIPLFTAPVKGKTAWLTRLYDWTLNPQMQLGFAAKTIAWSIAMRTSSIDAHWLLLYGTVLHNAQ